MNRRESDKIMGVVSKVFYLALWFFVGTLLLWIFLFFAYRGAIPWASLETLRAKLLFWSVTAQLTSMVVQILSIFRQGGGSDWWILVTLVCILISLGLGISLLF